MFKKIKQMCCNHDFEILDYDAFQHMNWWNEPTVKKIHYSAACNKCNKYVTDEVEFNDMNIDSERAEELIQIHLKR